MRACQLTETNVPQKEKEKKSLLHNWFKLFSLRLVQLQNLGYLDQNQYRHDIDTVVRSVSYSDWLILYYLAQSMDKKNFVALIKKIADDVSTFII